MERIYGSRLIGIKAAAKAFVVFQLEKVSIPLERYEISRLHHL